MKLSSHSSLILVSILFMMLISCQSNFGRHENVKVKGKNLHNSLFKKDSAANDDNVKITPLPFGPELLIGTKFPKQGWTEDIENPTPTKYGKLLLEADSVLGYINFFKKHTNPNYKKG